MNKHENTLIKQFMLRLKQDLQTINHHQKAIIFTGLTGSGKGTLIHYLMRNRRLYAKMQQTGDMVIHLKKLVNGTTDKITISNKITSDTSIPHQISYRGDVFRDLPGFMDNRDQQNYIPQDIINSFFIHQVYQKTNQIKIVFIASKNSLNDKATQFICSLTHFAQRFQTIDHMIQSILLVVTKVPYHLQLKHVKAILSRILNELKNQIPQKTRFILQSWVANQDLVQLFKIPQKQGQLQFKQSQFIYQKLRKIPFSQSPTINNIISQHSQSKMIELQQKWNQSISQICFQLVKSSYQEYLMKIQKIKMLNTAKSNLNYLRHKLDQLMGSQTPSQFKSRLKQIPELYKSNSFSKSAQLIKQFQQQYNFLQLFTKIHPDIHNTPKWKQPLYKIHYNISQLVSQPWQQVHGSDMYIKGFVIQSNVIQKKINFYRSNNPSQKSKVVIFAYFFIMNQDIQYPGGNLMIYTQYLIVQGKNTKIRLNGQNAKDYPVLIADDNQDGQPGRPGQNGGNLLLKVYQKSQNLQYFSVDLRGGRGGKGKNGGQIKLNKINKIYINYLMHDKQLPTNEKQYLIYRQDYKFSQRNIFSKMSEVFRILATYNGQVVEYYSTENEIEKNIDNFFYTLGGAGGRPGQSGNFHYNENEFIFSITQPQPSINGEGHIQVYEGLYVKEMIFPNFRDEGKQYNLKTLLEQKKYEIQFQNVEQQMRRRLQKTKLRMRKRSVSLNNSPDKQSPQKQNSQGKTVIQDTIFTTQQIRQMANEVKKQLQEEQQQLRTPLLYKTKYKQQTQFFDDQYVIKEQQNQQDDADRASKLTRRKNNIQNFFSDQKIMPQKTNLQFKRGLTSNLQIHSKLSRKPILNISNLHNRMSTYHRSNTLNQPTIIPTVLDQQSQSSDIRSVISRRTNNTQQAKYMSSRLLTHKRKNQNQTIPQNQSQSQSSGNNEKKIKPDLLINQLKEKAPQWGKQVGKQLATDIGTGTVQKVAKKIIDKVWQKAIRTGLTMQKQVFKQFAEAAIKTEADKKLLAQLGILTSNSFKQQIAKAVTQKGQQLILTQFGKQVIKDTAGIMQRQAVKHIGQDLVRRIGTHAASQAQIQIAAKSLSTGTVYVQGMLTGLLKSIMFQILLSGIMASGVTDGWIIKPHFKSKKLDLKRYNYEGIQDPQPQQDFTQQQKKITQSEYNFFYSSFKQFQNVFANKI